MLIHTEKRCQSPRKNFAHRSDTDTFAEQQTPLSDALRSLPAREPRGFGLTISHPQSSPVAFIRTLAPQAVKCFRKALLIPRGWEYKPNFILLHLEMSACVYNNFTATLFMH